MFEKLDVLYVDNHLLVVRKPPRMLVQGDITGDITLLEIAKKYIKEKWNKPGNVFLNLIHRIDRPVSGTVVFARTSKASSRLSEQFRLRECKKVYWALVEGKTPKKSVLIDYIKREGVTSRISDKNIGKYSELSYIRKKYHNGISFLEIELVTGRHHQIRVQLAHQKFPIIGDMRYGSVSTLKPKVIALHSRSLILKHPTQKKDMEFISDVYEYWPEVFSK